MRIICAVIGTLVAVVMMAGLSAIFLLSPASSRPSRAAYSVIEACVTVTPKSLAVGINGQNIVIGPAGVPRTCVGV